MITRSDGRSLRRPLETAGRQNCKRRSVGPWCENLLRTSHQPLCSWHDFLFLDFDLTSPKPKLSSRYPTPLPPLRPASAVWLLPARRPINCTLLRQPAAALFSASNHHLRTSSTLNPVTALPSHHSCLHKPAHYFSLAAAHKARSLSLADRAFHSSPADSFTTLHRNRRSSTHHHQTEIARHASRLPLVTCTLAAAPASATSKT